MLWPTITAVKTSPLDARHERADALYVRVSAAAKAKWGDDYIDPDTLP